jgi:hypothetical protein
VLVPVPWMARIRLVLLKRNTRATNPGPADDPSRMDRQAPMTYEQEDGDDSYGVHVVKTYETRPRTWSHRAVATKYCARSETSKYAFKYFRL